ncbi:transposase [Planctomycetota bacterium]|nr:transposase [Planctomycetota bacterium]
MARKRTKLSRELKADAVELVRKSDKNVAQVARNIDLTESALAIGLQGPKPTQEGAQQAP